MAGLILDEDIATVRERASLADVVSEAGISLRSAGGGRLKGLCPFHDEKSPSFNVNPALGYFMCFGCGESGDVISFLRQHESLTFVEAIERLARRYNVELRRADDGDGPSAQDRAKNASQRTRLLDLHRVTAAYFAAELAGPKAAQGRQFLADRGFTHADATGWNIGYAPEGWDNLGGHLRGKGFTSEEMILGGVASQGSTRGPIDRFRNRLIWPIRDITGDVIGFGARKLSTDPKDDSPKYLNSPETPIYKKSQVLYGLDTARKDIVRSRRAVVVEGYTDVMACHAAGVTTAVATCGTAFGSEHIAVIRRLLLDQDGLAGEVVFTFDGDAAGQKAALKAFGDDQKFVTQTYIAVSPGGMDPCELRLALGDAALAKMVDSRVPSVEFAVKTTISAYDLATAEGTIGALNAAAPLIAQIKDRTLRPVYARRLAGWLGMDPELVLPRVGELSGRGSRSNEPSVTDGRVRLMEREVCKVLVQSPEHVPGFDELPDDAFTDPACVIVQRLARECGGAAANTTGEKWIGALRDRAGDDDAIRSFVAGLAVEGSNAPHLPAEEYGLKLITSLRKELLQRREVAMRRDVPAEIVGTGFEGYNAMLAKAARRRGNVGVIASLPPAPVAVPVTEDDTPTGVSSVGLVAEPVELDAGARTDVDTKMEPAVMPAGGSEGAAANEWAAQEWAAQEWAVSVDAEIPLPPDPSEDPEPDDWQDGPDNPFS